VGHATKPKPWAGGMAQVVERLLSKLEAPSSKPSTIRKRKKKPKPHLL
jgi:hypothetical protein